MSKFYPIYDYPDTIILLSSSDRVLFRVHSIVLKLASGFFKQVLEIPRGEPKNPDDPLPLSEDGKTVAPLWDSICPCCDNTISIGTYDEAWEFMRVAEKYDTAHAERYKLRFMRNQHSSQTIFKCMRFECHWNPKDAIVFAAGWAVKLDIFYELYQKTSSTKELTDFDALNLLRFR